MAKADEDEACESRSRHLKQRSTHLYTSRRSVNGGPWIVICSWCEKPQPLEQPRP